MRKVSVLALVCDIGLANMIVPLLQELERLGHTVTLLAEDSGEAKNHLEVPFSVVDTEVSLRAHVVRHWPDIIMTGFSALRFLETILDRMAKESGTPLVHLEDYWAVHTRGSDEPGLYITIDEFSERLLKKIHPRVPIVVAGLVGVSLVTPSPGLISSFDAIRQRTGGKVLVYPDGGPMCERALPLFVESVLRTNTHVTVVPKFHPAFKTLVCPLGGTWDQWCHSQLGPLRACHRVVDFVDSTDEVIEAADGVASSFSTTLIRAACAGKLALTLLDEVSREIFKKSTQLDETPLIRDGRFPVLTESQSLDRYFAVTQPVYVIKPFDPSIAARAVLALARSK